MDTKVQIRLYLGWLLSTFGLAAGTSVQASELALANAPLFLVTQIDPNIFFVMDDSGSMDWEILTVNHTYYRDYWGDASLRGENRSGVFEVDPNSGVCTSRDSHYYLYDSGTNRDNLYGGCNRGQMEDHPDAYDLEWRVKSSSWNIMYYNPAATYRPWQGYSNADFFDAHSNPEPSQYGYNFTRDLTGFEYDVWIDNLGSDPTVNGPDSVRDERNDVVDLWDSRDIYTVGSSSVTVREVRTNFAGVDGSPDCSYTDAYRTSPYQNCFGATSSTYTISGATEDAWGRTVAEIQQNIANWYEFHRRRSYVAKSALSKVVSSNTSFRFGITVLNDTDDLFVEVPSILVEDYDEHNADLIDRLFKFRWNARGTPLRSGLERAGRYYMAALSGRTDPIISACQQNYSVTFTDGYWSSDSLVIGAIGDEDADGDDDTLADVAHYFYNTDLSPLPNDVPTSTLDQNEAQHMVSFTVAFGVEGNLTDNDNDRLPDTPVTESSGWHDGFVNTDPEKIDDVWHAAYNSKGYFVSAQSTDGVAAAIAQALLEIADRVGSAASVATNTGSLNAGSKLFQARFDSSDWKGQLLAFQINLDGSIEGFPTWEAGSILNATNWDTGREIITFNPDVDFPVGGDVEGRGVPFRFPSAYQAPNPLTELSSEQVNLLLTNASYDTGTADVSKISQNQQFGSDIVAYFRGDDDNELEGQGFRLRNSILGDIVNSDPNFVDVPNNRYPNDIEAKPYADFITEHANRQGVVYVGANDGMLHAFNDDTGEEMLAYIPSKAYDHLWELALPDYEHRYFVDGGPNIIDVFLDDTPDPGGGGPGVWATMLAGGLNGGGQLIYALNVTDPGDFDESNAADIVQWEFTDEHDADLGYTYGRPQIAKMQDGTWAAVFGNGYNNTEADGNASTTGHAVLYIVDVETGELLKKIDTGAGSVGTPNGLSTPLLVDVDGDFVVDLAYAGDLQGNLWKFDLTAENPNNWKVAGGASPRPLFTTDANQPITSQPQAAFHPFNLGGYMLYFGTGKYLEITDNDGFGQTTQAFYGVWDKDVSSYTAMDSSTLLEQTITNQYQESFDTPDGEETFTLRDVSDNDIDWDAHDGWVLSLIPEQVEGSPNANNFGERQVSNAIVRNGRIIFTTLVPSTVECEFVGTSFLMELDFRNGSALEFVAFDLNGDGEYDGDDSSASGRASDVGIMPTVSILADGAHDVAFGSGASGDIDVIDLSVGIEAYGRQSWRQLE